MESFFSSAYCSFIKCMPWVHMEGWRVRMGKKEWVDDPGSEIQKKPSDPGVEKAGSRSRSTSYRTEINDH
jgi:hypothetical protein